MSFGHMTDNEQLGLSLKDNTTTLDKLVLIGNNTHYKQFGVNEIKYPAQ